MDPESHKLLLEIKGEVEENRKILYSLRRAARLSSFFSLLKWILILGATAISYILAMPYLEQMMKVYQSIESSSQKINQASQSFPQGVADWFKKL